MRLIIFIIWPFSMAASTSMRFAWRACSLMEVDMQKNMVKRKMSISMKIAIPKIIIMNACRPRYTSTGSSLPFTVLSTLKGKTGILEVFRFIFSSLRSELWFTDIGTVRFPEGALSEPGDNKEFYSIF